MTVAEAQRPVRDSLPAFQATRGGVTFAPGLGLGSVDIAGSDSAVSVFTEADAIADATKAIQVVPCADPIEVKLQAVVRRLRFANLLERAWPELVAGWQTIVLSAHARLAESQLLAQIGAASTSITGGPQNLSAARDWLDQITRAAVGYRSRHRMRHDARMRVIAPSWFIGMLQSDVSMAMNAYPEQHVLSEQNVRDWLGVRNLNLTLTDDGETSGGAQGQIFGAQPAGIGVVNYPDVIVAYAFPEGSFAFLDGGELDLGIVRDSTLNATNDAELFSESFEAVAHLGPQSLKVTSTVCASGASAGTETPTCSGS